MPSIATPQRPRLKELGGRRLEVYIRTWSTLYVHMMDEVSRPALESMVLVLKATDDPMIKKDKVNVKRSVIHNRALMRLS